MSNLLAESQKFSFPELRQDLKLLESETLISGQPAWLIYDPVTMKHLQISQRIMRALSHWHQQDAKKIVRSPTEQDGDKLAPQELERLIEFLYENQLTLEPSPKAENAFKAGHVLGGKSIFSWLVHNYLFVRVPIFRPDKFLNATLPIVRPFSSWMSITLIVLLTFFGLLLVTRNWVDFIEFGAGAFSTNGAISFGLALIFVKSMHELGHAYFAAHRGLRVPAIGVAFMVMAPFLYSDVSEVWRLKSRYQRLLIDFAGILVELCLAGIATFLWAVWPDGPVRSALFFVATTSWALSLLVNFNPFMRFDGYYILSDFLGVSNLQTRSFALAKWQLRKSLFSLHDPAPEAFPGKMKFLLVSYAWTVWIYRFFLFLGIAVLVYATFFKALGIVLFIIEILWFILLPIWREVTFWWSRRADIMNSKRLWLPCILLIGFLALIFLPIWGTIVAPAMLASSQNSFLYSPVSGQIVDLYSRKGAKISAGDVVLKLRSPELEQRLDAAEKRLKALTLRATLVGAGSNNRSQELVVQSEIQSTKRELVALQGEQNDLVVHAPNEGTLVQMDPALRPDLWLKKGQKIAKIVDLNNIQIKLYLAEDEARRITPDVQAKFVPDDPARATMTVSNPIISRTATRTIEVPALTAPNGGIIPVTKAPDGSLIADKGYFVLIFDAPSGATTDRAISGIAHLQAKPQTLAQIISRQIAKVLIREIN